MISLLFLAHTVVGLTAPAPCFGLETYGVGSTWTYAGTRVWSQGNPIRVDSGAVVWTTTVIETRTVRSGRLILVRGFISEIAWSDPTTSPRLSILACTSGRLMHREFLSDSGARQAMDFWADSLLVGARLIVQQPLRDGAMIGQDPRRNDRMYGWEVERLDADPPPPQRCHPSGPEAYRLTMRTAPDDQVVVWRAGIGITAYQYGHHGTPASADVHLVQCQPHVSDR